MRYIDVHCHLTDENFKDTDNLIKSILSSKVEKIITCGTTAKDSEKCLILAEKYENVYFTAGIHPTELSKYKEGDIDKVRALLSHSKCVAAGEIGLDYHYPDTDKEKQMRIFKAQLAIAREAKLPVEIHSRDSAEDMLTVLKDYIKDGHSGVLLHCYSHSTEIASELEKYGVAFSFGGTSTYSGSKKAKRTIRTLDCKSLLTETDSPYLPPKSMYGAFPNTPASIPEILCCMAETRGESEEELSKTVWDNAHRLFKKLN